MTYRVRVAPRGKLLHMTYKIPLVERFQEHFTIEKYNGRLYRVPVGEVHFKSEMGVRGKVINKREAGDIKSFSYRSRSRMGMLLASLDSSKMPVFITLTYHEDFPQDNDVVKYHLRKFHQALVYNFGGGGVWKLEYQERGAPHYHLLYWADDTFSDWSAWQDYSLQELRDYVPGAWHKIAGAGSAWHLSFHRGELGNEHCVGQIRSWNGVLFYASKYMSKIQGAEYNGRAWGKFGKLPLSPVVEYKLSEDNALLLQCAMQKRVGREFSRVGFWMNNDDMTVIDYLHELECASHVENNPPDNFPPGDDFLDDGFFYSINHETDFPPNVSAGK